MIEFHTEEERGVWAAAFGATFGNGWAGASGYGAEENADRAVEALRERRKQHIRAEALKDRM